MTAADWTVYGFCAALLSLIPALWWATKPPSRKPRRQDRIEDERRAAARELALIVENARRYRLPLVVEPTRKVRGQVVYPMIGLYSHSSTTFDESGVPQ